jgi:hypothetical protein
MPGGEGQIASVVVSVALPVVESVPLAFAIVDGISVVYRVAHVVDRGEIATAVGERDGREGEVVVGLGWVVVARVVAANEGHTASTTVGAVGLAVFLCFAPLFAEFLEFCGRVMNTVNAGQRRGRG